MRKRALVTGATGFIGQAVVKELLNTDCQHIVGISRHYGDYLSTLHRFDGKIGWFGADITSKEDISLLMKTFRPDYVFHLAGNAIIKPNEEDPTEITKTNVIGTHNLLEYAPDCRFLLASSAAVYGDGGTLKKCGEHDPKIPTSAYGASKVAAEAYLHAYSAQGRVHGRTLRYIANVGPGATHGVLRDVVKKLLSPAKELELFGDCPGSIKPYMHVRDTARATVMLAENMTDADRYYTTYNVGPSDHISIEELAKVAMLALDIQKPIKWLGKSSVWKGDNPVVQINNYLLTDFKNFKAEYPTSKQAIFAAAKELT